MKPLNLFTKFVSAATFILIVAGGLVTSTGSGLAVPDWPLSYGTLFPPMVGGILYEHSHRLIAGTVGLLTLGLFIVTLKTCRDRAVRWLSGIALLSVVVQALLGGLTVIYLLPLPISIAHACLGQTFFCILCVMTLMTGPSWRDQPTVTFAGASSLRNLMAIVCFFVYLQLILGAIVRHSKGEGITYHFINAFMVLMHLFFILHRIISNKRLAFIKSPALALMALIGLQIALGAGAYVLKFTLIASSYQFPPFEQVLIATSHQALGALILALVVTLALRVHRVCREEA